MIVGKRALPALALLGERGRLAEEVALLAREPDVVLVFGEAADRDGLAAALEVARERGCLTVALRAARRGLADRPALARPVHPAGARRDRLPHRLGALARLLRAPRPARRAHERRGHDAGASSFLYPFLSESENDLDGVLADVRASVGMKAGEIEALREQTVLDGATAIEAAATALREVFDRGGTLLALGNGGSATDAMDIVADLARPLLGGAPRRALDLSADPAIVTAIANDIGPQAVFTRQVIAYGARGRRADRVLDERRLAERDRRARRGATARARDDRAGRLRRGSRRRGRAGRPSHRQPLAAHPAHPGGARDGLAPAPRARRGGDARCERTARVRARVEGVVQGVGFRPFVYRLAREERLGGFVRNDERGVVLEVDGRADAVESFLARLAVEAPPLAVVERIDCDRLEPTGEGDFQIVQSVSSGDADALVAPDAATCDDCLRRARDPADRRFRYPFINCTNCGPRFTIVRGVPTTGRRRPWPPSRCALRAGASTTIRPTAASTRSRTPARRAGRGRGCWRGWDRLLTTPLRAAARRLADGALLAVKGIGGYHLACRRPTTAPWPSCVRASGARTARSR